MIIHQNTGTTSKDKGRTIFDLHSSPPYWCAISILSWSCWLGTLPRAFQKAVAVCVVRGKLTSNQTVSKERGTILERALVPHRWFCHFYLAGIFWTSALIVGITATTYLKERKHSSSNWDVELVSLTSYVSCVYHALQHTLEASSEQATVFILLGLFLLHCVRRLWECHYVSIFSPSSRMHLGAYIFGQTYYLLAALSLGLSQLPFRDTSTNAPWLTISRLLGVLTFAQGSLHQHRCHRILATLRSSRPALTDKTPARKPSTTDEGQVYKIPCGDWFDFLSCAHYTAEVVIYIGLLIVAGAASLSVWMMIFSVVGNLGLAAGLTHRWYLSHISSYPKNRKAFIPYVY
ncbi:hypothetical protein CYMTET_45842 [Cymbomonas tetramitiformis]|uniref:3-oxo-5-alpha-steroid 4-dehydrogenase C-terminal domain-containing protein n=1 Tax=Cymbomonas tetramitiformis TaxID=36881 RepID=A0AAE0BYK9_9CHLO|nr:hypothetical protein CYMTET_45842 [Cymbomonas tetramitiformis]